jgi:hypothetical protein
MLVMNTPLYIIASLHYYGKNKHAFFTPMGWSEKEEEGILLQSSQNAQQYIDINFPTKAEVTYIRYQPD